MLRYIGMGHVHVWSADLAGAAHMRVDGGANGYERAQNAHKALASRAPNCAPLSELVPQ